MTPDLARAIRDNDLSVPRVERDICGLPDLIPADLDMEAIQARAQLAADVLLSLDSPDPQSAKRDADWRKKPRKLTMPQLAMLRLVVQAGSCINIVPAVTREAWTVWDGGIARAFHESTGDWLVRKRLIEPLTKPKRASLGVMLRRYLPTDAARRICAEFKP